MDALVDGEPASPGPTVLIVARPTLYRLGLTRILRDAHPEWTLLELESTAAAERHLRQRRADMMLLDQGLMDCHGCETPRRLHACQPTCKILILGEEEARGPILACIDAGARGYITADAAPAQVLAAFDAVLCGGIFAPAGLTQERQDPRPSGIALQKIRTLTQRQQDVFALMAKGYSTKAIARELGVAVATVKVHLAAIYRQMGVHNRTEAVIRNIVGSPAQALSRLPAAADRIALAVARPGGQIA